MDFNLKIAKELNIEVCQVEETIKLLDEGCTIPFICRYRKEMTGELDEVIVMRIRDRIIQLRDLEKRRDVIIASVAEQGKMTDTLKQQFLSAETMTELEDLYLPYRPKRKTRASIAKEKGLEPMAKLLMAQGSGDVETMAQRYIDEKKGVKNVDEALQGARDIVAEWVNESKDARERLRILFDKEAVIYAHVVKGKEEEGAKYSGYYEFDELLKKAPSHRVLAVFRGENEGFLKVDVEPSMERGVEMLERMFVKNDSEAADHVKIAIFDSYKRLLQPSIENEIRSKYKDKADDEAIRVFAENLRQLLMSAPLHGYNVLAIDPGFRTGCKIVCLDKNGKLVHNDVVYPHPPENRVKESLDKILQIVDKFDIGAIAIGNGTAGRETESFVKRIPFSKELVIVMVNESGASVYSASAVAREEFPDYDITVRGAVSIGRRLIDPLAELVKIEPKSIGVGQYQHDVNQSKLHSGLEDVVVSCVNGVGVDLNTASKELLTYVSGVGASLAQNIVKYRNEKGGFKSRQELKKVTRFGEKAFEQSAGFLRIRDGINPLDNSSVHPESYYIVEKMAKNVGCDVETLIRDKSKRQAININSYIDNKIGLPTLRDIMKELEKPGRDPREEFEKFEFDSTVHEIGDLREGMKLPGVVTNITAFGAFVDVGVHQDGLIHLSRMSNKYIKDPNEVVKLNQKVLVTVVEVDTKRKRIGLSLV